MGRRNNLRQLAHAGRIDEALALLRRREKARALSASELVSKGMLLQVARDEHDLGEARSALEEALKLDDEYLPALLELAFFYHMVDDDSARALPLFEKANEISLASLAEALEGTARCLEELESPEAAERFLARAKEGIDVEAIRRKIDS